MITAKVRKLAYVFIERAVKMQIAILIQLHVCIMLFFGCGYTKDLELFDSFW